MVRRIKLGAIGVAAAIGSIVGVGALTPQAHAADLVQVCFTLHPRSVAVFVNGTPVSGYIIPGVPRTCIGI